MSTETKYMLLAIGAMAVSAPIWAPLMQRDCDYLVRFWLGGL